MKECDLLVVGSGAAGLSAAVTAAVLGLRVIVIEKEPVLGGATARSGGGVWIPGNDLSRRAGIDDSREAALTYIRHMTGRRFDPSKVAAFLSQGPEMLAFMERETAVRFDFLPGFPDYYCDEPGGAKDGRALFARSFDGRLLGDQLRRLRPTLDTSNFWGLQVGVDDLGYFLKAGRSLRSALRVCRRLFRLGIDYLRAGRTLRLTGGNALVGALLATAFKRGVEVCTDSPAVRLLQHEGRVVGATTFVNGKHGSIFARCGVVLATGGFPHDSALRARLFPAGATNANVWGVMPFGNSGDGIRLGESVGGYLNTDVASPVALTPMMRLNLKEGQLATFPVFVNRGSPGILAVTRDGNRFVNEARSYHEFGLGVLSAAKDEPQPAAWIIADRRALRRFGLGYAFPFPFPVGRHLRAGHLKTGHSLAELAARTGINADNLQSTVKRFNQASLEGTDPEFKRGSNAFDLAGVEPTKGSNPCLGPLDRPPFYAIEVYPGCVGTFAGLQTDENAAVVTRDGRVVAGLYAVGNDMLSITGGDYIGGGCTLGPGMTFGFIAARHAAAGSPQ